MTALIEGIAAAVVTVADRDAHLQLYRALGWEITAEVTVDAATARQLWSTNGARITVLAPGVRRAPVM